jgi:hypothetical protein
MAGSGYRANDLTQPSGMRLAAAALLPDPTKFPCFRVHLLSSDQVQQFHREALSLYYSDSGYWCREPILNPQEFPGFSRKHKQPLGLMASPKESEELAPQALTKL